MLTGQKFGILQIAAVVLALGITAVPASGYASTQFRQVVSSDAAIPQNTPPVTTDDTSWGG